MSQIHYKIQYTGVLDMHDGDLNNKLCMYDKVCVIPKREPYIKTKEKKEAVEIL
jgi:hypothetical protein